MNSKLNKIIILVFAFFIGLVPVMAKEVTFDELNKEVLEIQSDATYYYVIGEYVFTGAYGRDDGKILTIQDIMLASKSIEGAFNEINPSPTYDKMTINYVRKSGSTWVIEENICGKTDLKQEFQDKTKINIEFVDYVRLKTATKANFDLDLSKSKNSTSYQRLIETDYGFTGGNASNTRDLTYKDGKLTGLLKEFKGDLTGAGFSSEDKSGYYFSFFAEFEDEELVNSNSTITMKVTNVVGEEKITSTKVFKQSDFDSDLGIAMLFAYKKTSPYQTIELTFDYDGDNGKEDKYSPYTYTIDLSELKIPTVSSMDMSGNITASDIETYKTTWKYTKPDTVNYDFQNDTLTLDGTLVSQEIDNSVANFASDDQTGYYVLVNFNSSDFIPGESTIKIESGHNSTVKNVKEEIKGNDVSVLLSLKDNVLEPQKEFTVTVDLDGDGDYWLEKEYKINWKDLILVKSTKVSAKKEFSTEKDISELITNSLHVTGWDISNISRVTITPNNNIIEISGVLPKVNGVTGAGFKEAELTGYYLPFVLSLTENATSDTKVILPCNVESDTCVEGKKTIIGNSGFDTEKEVLIFASLRENETSFDIVVDLDGDKEEYAPYTLTFDYSKLILQKETKISETNVSNNVIGADKDAFINSYGYTFNLKDEFKITRSGETFKIEGKVHEQDLKKDGVFSSEEASGFYIPFNFKPDGYIKGKTVVTIPSKKGTETKDLVINDDLGASVLMAISKEKIAKCESTPEDCKFKVTIDLDGSDDQYMPTDIYIDYSKVNFISYIKATFNYHEPASNKVIKLYPGETINEDLVDEPTYDDYHVFSKWTDTKNSEFEFGKTVVNEDITLNPNWTILVSKYINAKVNAIEGNENYDKPTISGTNLTLKLKKNNLGKETLSNMLAPIILEVLNTKEIGKVTLSLEDGNNVDITNSDNATIKSNIEETLLSGKTDLDELITKKITISFEKKEDALVEFDSAEDYKLEITADFREVKNESELSSALETSGVNTIYVIESFPVDAEKVINRNITISGTNSKNTITSNGKDYVFKVSSGEVTFDNIKLTGAKVGIFANTGTITLNNIDLSNNTEAGMELSGNVTLKGDKNKIAYTNEAYETPLIRIPKEQKNNHKINIEGLTKVDTLYDVKKFDRNSDYNAESDVYIGDKLVAKEYRYINHYLDATKSNKWLKLVYIADRSITGKPIVYTVYFDKEKGKSLENNAEPANDIKYLTTFDGTLGTYTVDKWTSAGNTYSYGEVEPTKDGSYGIIYKVEYKEHVTEVSDEDALIEAVKSGDEKKVVVVKNEIVLEKELVIGANNISITGKVSGNNAVNGSLKGKIKVTGNNVRLSLMSITGNSVSDASEDKAVVTIEGTGFNSSQVKYNANNIGDNWESILCYTHENPTTVLFYNTFDGSNAKSLIDFKGKLAKDSDDGNNHSRLIGNTFKGTETTKEFIIIEEFEDGAKLEITQTEADFADTHEYGIRIKKPSTPIKATIDLGYDWFNSDDKKLKIALETDGSTDYSGLTIKGGRDFKGKVELCYLKDGREETTNDAGEANLIISE